MTRALVLAALLLACSPASDDQRAPASAAPAGNGPASGAPAAPAPTRQRSSPRSADTTLQAGNSYYQYVDESGHVRFATRLEDVPERQRSTAGHISLSPSAPVHRATSRPAEARAAGRPEATTSAEVVLYTTSTCPYCRRARAYLDQIGQPYVNKDVEEDEEARDEYLSLTSGRPGVPVIVVGDRWIQGWNQQKLAELLASAQ